MRTMHDRGYTLIELLVVVAVIGVLAAVAIPNLLNALDRARQKRTMADLRSLAEGIEMYQQDATFFPRRADVPVEALQEMLLVYLHRPIARDGWNRPFWYTSNGEHYTLQSFGRDGTPDAGGAAGATTHVNDDIVYSDGAFSRWPEGIQR